MTPLTLPGQNPLTTRISTEMPAPIWTYTDYWGTLVSSFDILAAHRDLVIRATASVETAAPAGLARPLVWPMLAERAGGGQLLEYLTPTERTTVNQGLAEAARQRVAGADPLAPPPTNPSSAPSR